MLALAVWLIALLALYMSYGFSFVGDVDRVQRVERTSQAIFERCWYAGRIWENRSLVGGGQKWHECRSRGEYSAPQPWTFTPARTWPSTLEDSRGVVVLLIGGLGLSKFNALFVMQMLQMRFESLCRYLLTPFDVPLLILLDREATISITRVVEKLKLVRTFPESHQNVRGCSFDMDEGYETYTFRGHSGYGCSCQVIIGRIWLDAPLWVKDIGRERFFQLHMKRWRARESCMPRFGFYSYIQTNRFYTHQLFTLQIMDLFDVWLKIDADVQILRPLPENPILAIARRRALMVHSGAIDLLAGCTVNLRQMVDTYLAAESEQCGHTVYAVGNASEWYWNETVAFYGNFLGGWLGYHGSPEFLQFSRHFNIFPNGLWRYRWTDQEMWGKAFGLVSDGSASTGYLLDLSAWRDHYFFHSGSFIMDVPAYVSFMETRNWKPLNPGKSYDFYNISSEFRICRNVPPFEE